MFCVPHIVTFKMITNLWKDPQQLFVEEGKLGKRKVR